MNITDGLSFEDILIRPKYSTIKSRSDVDLSLTLPKVNITLKHPFIPANMKTVIGLNMAREVCKSGGLSILHRFCAIEEQLQIVYDLQQEFNHDVWNYIGFSIGVKKQDYQNIDYLINHGAKIICIDVAHGDHILCHDMCKYISQKYPQVLLIAGNVATKEAVIRLWEVGIDIIKINIGSGSICSTRIQTGNGVPSISALLEAHKAITYIKEYESEYGGRKKRIPLIIADGGIKAAGDCVKALCFADLVMVGNLFAGCDESPSNKISIDGITYKEYQGSSTYKTSHVEGVKGLIPYRGKFIDILNNLSDGLKSGMAYQNAKILQELKLNPEFIKISQAGLTESHPHSIKVL